MLRYLTWTQYLVIILSDRKMSAKAYIRMPARVYISKMRGKTRMNIIKRDGSEVVFEKQKIALAITKANSSVFPRARLNEEQIANIADDVESAAAHMNRALSVEEIQDMVEDQIMDKRAFEVARNYITYR